MYIYVYTYMYKYVYTYEHINTHTHVYTHLDGRIEGWLRIVGSLKVYVSIAQYRLFYRALLQK